MLSSGAPRAGRCMARALRLLLLVCLAGTLSSYQHQGSRHFLSGHSWSAFPVPSFPHSGLSVALFAAPEPLSSTSSASISLTSPSTSSSSPIARSSKPASKRPQGPTRPSPPKPQVGPGSIVEYFSNKGTRMLALVKARVEGGVELINDAKISYTVPLKRISYTVEGNYSFGDLLKVQEMITDFKPLQVERLWETAVEGQTGMGQGQGMGMGAGQGQGIGQGQGQGMGNMGQGGQGQRNVPLSVETASLFFYRSSDPVRCLVTSRVMEVFGSVYFEATGRGSGGSNGGGGGGGGGGARGGRRMVTYTPFSPAVVQENLRDRAALREFKQRFNKIMCQTKDPDLITAPVNAASGYQFLPEMPERMEKVLFPYTQGLRQFALQKHIWVSKGWAPASNEQDIAKGCELLEYLGLAPNFNNAKKVLEVIGAWSPHENVEKYVMQIRDKFPPEVLAEAQALLANADTLEDPDERLRRDLRSLGTYAIDREGASEVDDAISIEYVEVDGRPRQKLWMHIADVSKWVRPGSQLSLEAERRMASVYMPDERISMFPDSLSTELLSLGANVDSFALSCGVILDSGGRVTSYEVCPSKIRVTRRLTYTQLDDVLARHTIESGDGAGAGGGSEGVSGGRGGVSEDGVRRPKAGGGVLEVHMMDDLVRLNNWALLRHSHRVANGALDAYLRHKTELNLSVKRDPKMPTKVTVSGAMGWSNSSSVCTVSEYMILMSQTIGAMCSNASAPRVDLGTVGSESEVGAGIEAGIEAGVGVGAGLGSEGVRKANIPVWFKTQAADPPLKPEDVELRAEAGETPFLRAARIMRHLRTSNDSKVPGPHVTSGSTAYVQCTSPIRRYHDLYNHYRLKTALHAASMSDQWAHRAEAEAGLQLLDSMATDSQRLRRLEAIRMVTRHREQYWRDIYVSKVIHAVPQVEFDCMVYGPLAPETGDGGVDSLSGWATSGSSFSGSGGVIKGGASRGSGGVGNGSASGGSGGSWGSGGSGDSGVGVDGRDAAGFRLYEALILQLGSFTHYRLWHRDDLQPGQMVKGCLYRRATNPVSLVLLPADVRSEEHLPPMLREAGRTLLPHPCILPEAAIQAMQ